MKPEDFCKWLQGFFEVSEVTALNPRQTLIVKEKLDTVFEHYAELISLTADGNKLAKLTESPTKLEVPKPTGTIYNHMPPENGDWMEGERVRC